MNVLLIILVILASFLCLQSIFYMWIMVAIKREELDSQREYISSIRTPTQRVYEDSYTGGE